MTGRDSAYTPNKLRIKPADRMAASREILRRGYGHFGRRRRLIDDAEETNDYDTLHTDLAKRLRQYSEEGSQVILFLLNVMKNEVPDEEYTTRHRMSAAQELLRRGWDTNYDKIKSEHLIDYWQEQQSARLSVGQKKQLAGLQTYADEYDAYDNKDYEPQAQALHAQQDRESEARDRQANNGSPRQSREDEAASPRHSREERESSRAERPSSQQHPFPLDGKPPNNTPSPLTTSQNTGWGMTRTKPPFILSLSKDLQPPVIPKKTPTIPSTRHSRASGNPEAQNEETSRQAPPTPTQKTPTTTPNQTPTPSKTATTNP